MPNNTDAAIRAKLDSMVEGPGNLQSCAGCEYDCHCQAYLEYQAALLAVLDRHKPGFPNGVEYEERDEAVYNEDGLFRGYMTVRGEPSAPYWCEICHEMSPCSEQKVIAAALGIETTDG